MINKFSIREAIAWVTLVLAILLFSISVSFAQSRSVTVINNSGKVHLKVQEEENGRIVKIDTTFAVATDQDADKAIDEILENAGIGGMYEDRGVDESGLDKETGKKKRKIIIDREFSENGKRDLEKIDDELNEAIHDMQNNLDEIYQSLKRLHIHLDDAENFNFDFDMPERELMEKSRDHSGDREEMEWIDSLSDADHIVVPGGNGKGAPVLERVVTSPGGRQYFIFKHDGASAGSKDASERNRVTKDELEVYPNPSTGSITVSYESKIKGPLTISIYSDEGKLILSEKQSDFNGNFSKEFNLAATPKGNYLLKVSQGKRSSSVRFLLK